MRVLTVNAGSSSLRLGLYRGTGESWKIERACRFDDRAVPARALRDFIGAANPGSFDTLAHRVVHGGLDLTEPCRITAAVERRIEELCALAPLHNPPALALIRAARELFGASMPQIAVFDTALYATLPEVARRYALPEDLVQRHGLYRYGFHGLAHRSMLRGLAELHEGALPARVLSLQLGSGCSITAWRDGRPVDTTMGFSPLEGLVMATRCGDLDAGVIIHLMREGGLAADELTDLLYRRSGLLGVCGISADMQALLESADAGASPRSGRCARPQRCDSRAAARLSPAHGGGPAHERRPVGDGASDLRQAGLPRRPRARSGGLQDQARRPYRRRAQHGAGLRRLSRLQRADRLHA